jgi:hypothetical protein
MWWTLFIYCNHPQNNQSGILLSINLERFVCHNKEKKFMPKVFKKNKEICDAFVADCGRTTIFPMGT